MLARAIVCLAVAAALQSPFRTETRLVVLHATVRNERGALVTGLGREAFTVFENGRRQPIALFRSDDVPVSVGLLVDNSGSMRTKRQKVEAAALAFVRASNPDDEVFIVNFADRPRLDAPMTGDIRRLEAGVRRVDSIGGTAMRDAVAMAEDYLEANSHRDRRALVIITDGNDNASDAALDRIRTRAQQRGVVVYAIGLLNDQTARRGRHEIDDLVVATGGAAAYPDSLEQIDDAALELARQIRLQYTIAYTPLNQALDGSFRKIRVEVSGPGHLEARTRAGYRATSDIAGAVPEP